MTESEIRAFWLDIVPTWALSEILFYTAEKRIADEIGNGPTDLAVIAERTGANPETLRRLLNALAAHGIFERSGIDRYSATPLSNPLRSDVFDSQRAYIALGRLMMHEAWSSFEETMSTGLPAFDLRFGEPAFEYIGKHPALATAFAAAMTSTTRRAERALVAARAFGEFSLVVDVGGSLGSLVRLLLAEHPNSRGIVFDRPEIAEAASRHWAGDADATRLQAIGGSFFDTVPGGADLYLLKQILHDWQDPQCIAILRNVRTRMSPGARVAIVEMVLPDDGSAHPGWMYDLLMMTMTGGRERSAVQFAGLLGQSGLRMERLIPTASVLSIIEAKAA